MIKHLIKLTNYLDSKGLRKEADYLDAMIRKLAAEKEITTEERLSMPEGSHTQHVEAKEELTKMFMEYLDSDKSGAIESGEVPGIVGLFKRLISEYAKKHDLPEEDSKYFISEEIKAWNGNPAEYRIDEALNEASRGEHFAELSDNIQGPINWGSKLERLKQMEEFFPGNEPNLDIARYLGWEDLGWEDLKKED